MCLDKRKELALMIISRKWANKTNKMACAPSEDSDQHGHPPSMIRVFAVHIKKAWVLSYPLSAQRRLWSDWVDAQADLSLHWEHRSFCRFCHEADQMWKSYPQYLQRCKHYNVFNNLRHFLFSKGLFVYHYICLSLKHFEFILKTYIFFLF